MSYTQGIAVQGETCTGVLAIKGVLFVWLYSGNVTRRGGGARAHSGSGGPSQANKGIFANSLHHSISGEGGRPGGQEVGDERKRKKNLHLRAGPSAHRGLCMRLCVSTKVSVIGTLNPGSHRPHEGGWRLPDGVEL